MTDILNLPAEDMASMNDDSKRGHALVLQQQVIGQLLCSALQAIPS